MPSKPYKLITKKPIDYAHEKRFGGHRESVFIRDKYSCVMCGMTMSEHIARWSRQLTIDHKDGKGRYSNIPNNEISNLQTLCLVCHSKKDVKNRNWRKGNSHGRALLNDEEVINIRFLYSTKIYKIVEIAAFFKVSASTVSLIVHKKIWKNLITDQGD